MVIHLSCGRVRDFELHLNRASSLARFIPCRLVWLAFAGQLLGFPKLLRIWKIAGEFPPEGSLHPADAPMPAMVLSRFEYENSPFCLRDHPTHDLPLVYQSRSSTPTPSQISRRNDNFTYLSLYTTCILLHQADPSFI
jgi:hypothetical protein